MLDFLESIDIDCKAHGGVLDTSVLEDDQVISTMTVSGYVKERKEGI